MAASGGTPAGTEWLHEPWPEIAAGVLILGLVLLVYWRLMHFVRVARERRGVGNYLLGVEAALHGDPVNAEKRLRSVLDLDPENLGARMLLAKVQLQLDEPGAAHEAHLILQRSFGMATPDSQAGLAASLLALDRAQEAEGVVGDATGKDVGSDVHAVHFQSLLAAGRHADAVGVGRRWVARTVEPAARRRAEHQVAGAAARAGIEALQAGDSNDARRHLKMARQLDVQHPQVAELVGRMAVSGAGSVGEALSADTLQQLLLELDGGSPLSPHQALLAGQTTGLELPSPKAPVVERPHGEGVDAGGGLHPAVAILQRLVPGYAWRCARCGAAAKGPSAPCGACGARNAVQAVEPRLGEAVDDPSALMDAVEANLQHLKRQAECALKGDTEATHELQEGGVQGVAAVLSVVLQDPANESAAIGLFLRMGPGITGDLLHAFQEVGGSKKSVWRSLVDTAKGNNERLANFVGRVLMEFGADARQYVEPLLGTADRNQRKLLIDYHIGLADPERFAGLLNQFPLLEILHRINQADPEAVQRFFATLPAGHPVLTVLVQEKVFSREIELLRALPDAADAEALLDALCQRVPGSHLIRAAIEGLRDPEQRRSCRRLLGRLGSLVVEHLVECFADLDRPDELRREVSRLLVQVGPPSVAELCEAYGPDKNAVDEPIDTLLVELGGDAVPALLAAYGQKGMAERIAGPLMSRFTHRRDRIVMAIARIGGPGAGQALRQLRQSESDRNLKLRLDLALQSVDESRSPEAPIEEQDPQGPTMDEQEGRSGGAAG